MCVCVWWIEGSVISELSNCFTVFFWSAETLGNIYASPGSYYCKNYMCILWDRKYIVLLSDNKQNRNMSFYTQKNVVDAFGLVSVFTSVMLFPWFWHPWDGSWVNLLSPLLITWCELDVSAHHPSSELLPGWVSTGSCPGPPKETREWTDRQSPMLIWILLFPQLNWCSSMGRVCRSPGLPWEGDNLVGCKIKQFCHVVFFFPLDSSLGCVYPASACERIV